MKWLAYALLALVISLIPCALFPEFIVPFSSWEQWEYAHGKNVTYSGANYPPVLRAEIPVFVAIVIPPSRIASSLGYHLTMYGYLAETSAGLWPPGNSFHYGPPPSVALSEFLIIAVPFWFVSVATIAHLTSWLLARRRMRFTRRGTAA